MYYLLRSNAAAAWQPPAQQQRNGSGQLGVAYCATPAAGCISPLAPMAVGHCIVGMAGDGHAPRRRQTSRLMEGNGTRMPLRRIGVVGVDTRDQLHGDLAAS